MWAPQAPRGMLTLCQQPTGRRGHRGAGPLPAGPVVVPVTRHAYWDNLVGRRETHRTITVGRDPSTPPPPLDKSSGSRGGERSVGDCAARRLHTVTHPGQGHMDQLVLVLVACRPAGAIRPGSRDGARSEQRTPTQERHMPALLPPARPQSGPLHEQGAEDESRAPRMSAAWRERRTSSQAHTDHRTEAARHQPTCPCPCVHT